MEKAKPVSNELYLSKEFKLAEYLDKEGGIYVEPTPCLVIKMWTYQGEKVFINLLYHAIISEPEEKYILEMEQQGVRVPMSVSLPREDFDKSKEPCKVIDCIVAPKVC